MPRRKPHRPGRPLVIAAEETRKTFLDAVRLATPLEHAAHHAGITYQTVRNAILRGEDAQQRQAEGQTLTEDDQICVEFLEEYGRARSAAVIRNLGLVQRVAQGGYLVRRRTLPNGTVEEEHAGPDWRAAEAMLRRVLPSADRVEVTGAGGGPVRVEASEALVALGEQLSARLAIGAGDEGEVLDGEVVDDGEG